MSFGARGAAYDEQEAVFVCPSADNGVCCIATMTAYGYSPVAELWHCIQAVYRHLEQHVDCYPTQGQGAWVQYNAC